MAGNLPQIRAELAGVRRRLEELARRLGAAREWATAGETPAPVLTAPAPLFGGQGGAGPLDDVELHFEVLDTEDPGREGR